jgi:hypothetical protein
MMEAEPPQDYEAVLSAGLFARLIFYPEGGSIFIRNIGKFLPYFTASDLIALKLMTI